MKRIFITLFFCSYLFLLFSINLWENPTSLSESSFIKGIDATISMPQGVVIVWSEARNNVRSVYAQCIMQDASKLWEEDGIKLTLSNYHQYSHKVIKSDDNSFIVTWIEENQSTYKYYAQKVSMDGQRLWGDYGLFIKTELYLIDINQIIPDNSGGFFIFTTEHFNTLINHIDSSGQILPQITISLNEPDNEFPVIIINAFYKEGQGIYISYYQHNKVKICQCNINGEIIWNQVFQTDSYTPQSAKMIEDSEGKFIILLNHYGLIAQKYDSDGTTLWGNVPKVIYSTQLFMNLNFSAINDNSNNLLIAYRNPVNQLVLTKIDENGNNEWLNPVLLFSTYNGPTMVDIVTKNDDYYIYWDTTVYTNDLYLNIRRKKFQKISPSGQILLDDNGRTIFESSTSDHYIPFINGNSQFFISNYSYTDNITTYIMNSSDEITTPDHPLTIYQGKSSYVDDFIMLTHDNKTYVLWKSISIQNYQRSQLFYQVIDSNGNKLLDQEGQLISTIESCGNCFYSNFDNMGNLIILWSYSYYANRFLKHEIRLQKIDVNGNFIFPEEGLLIYEYSFSQIPDISMYFSNNDIFIYFTQVNQENNCKYIIGQKVSNNQVMWNIHGKEIVNKAHFPSYDNRNVSCNLLSVGINNHIIVWKEMSNFTNNNMKYLILNSDGNAIDSMDPQGELLFNYYQDTYFPLYRSRIIEFENQILCFASECSNQSMLDYAVINPEGVVLIEQQRLIEENNLSIFNIEWDNQLSIHSYDIGTPWHHISKKYSFLFQDNHLIPLWENPQILQSTNHFQNILTLSDLSFNTYIYSDSIYNNYAEFELFDNHGFQIDQPIRIFSDYNNHTIKRSVIKADNSCVMYAWLLDNPRSEYSDLRSLQLQKISIDTGTNSDNIPHNHSTPLTIQQNYPNPFNPKTKIAYNINSDTNIDICIFNIKGQKVKTLLSEFQPAGNHEVIWDGQDSNNNAVPSGVYFYKIQTEKQTETRKMLLLK